MKTNILEYKGYHTKVEYFAEESLLRGKIEGINDLVNFECENAKDVENEFHQAVDDYLLFCEEVGKEPEKEYKGTFNVRITPSLHKNLAVIALKNGETLNATVEKAIQEYVSSANSRQNHVQIQIKISAEAYKPETIASYAFMPTQTNSNVIPFPSKINMKYGKEM